tara:strand:+ start:38576 stop:38890 length:315 start_codon:yes stop_codon:yes gene_type:complete
MMKRTLFPTASATALALSLLAGATIALQSTPAYADDDKETCDAPADKWLPKQDLEAKLKADGWTIKNIKVEDGCYEVYAIDKDGKRVEAYFDPETFEAVKTKED